MPIHLALPVPTSDDSHATSGRLQKIKGPITGHVGNVELLRLNNSIMPFLGGPQQQSWRDLFEPTYRKTPLYPLSKISTVLQHQTTIDLARQVNKITNTSYCSEIQQAPPPQAVLCVESTIPSQGILSRIAKVKSPIPDSGYSGFLLY